MPHRCCLVVGRTAAISLKTVKSVIRPQLQRLRIRRQIESRASHNTCREAFLGRQDMAATVLSSPTPDSSLIARQSQLRLSCVRPTGYSNWRSAGSGALLGAHSPGFGHQQIMYFKLPTSNCQPQTAGAILPAARFQFRVYSVIRSEASSSTPLIWVAFGRRHHLSCIVIRGRATTLRRPLLGSHPFQISSQVSSFSSPTSAYTTDHFTPCLELDIKSRSSTCFLATHNCNGA